MAKIIIPSNTKNCINQIMEVQTKNKLSTLFIGNYQAATDIAILRQYRITAILTVATQLNLSKVQGISNKVIPVQDNVFQNLSQYFSETNEFIYKNLQKGNVLVHCRAGISRSATVVLAFMMKQKRYRLKKAIQKLQNVRSITKPNEGFMMQLKQYERKISKVLESKQLQLK